MHSLILKLTTHFFTLAFFSISIRLRILWTQLIYSTLLITVHSAKFTSKYQELFDQKA